MKIKDFKEEHPAIYDLALKRVQEAGNASNDEIKLSFTSNSGGFNWGDTEEGYEFWEDIHSGKFQTFYDRYPEYAKDPVRFSVEEKDWSKATKAELIQKANIDYPIGTRVKEPSYGVKEFTVSGLPMIDSDLDIMCIDENGNHRYLLCCYRKNEFKWAEIIDQPKQASPESKKYFEANNPGMIFTAEPKAGDMVEVLNPDWRSGWTYLGVKNTKGYYICEEIGGKVQAFEKIRLPQKSEVESKANEFYDKWNLPPYTTTRQMIIEAIKWGQQNPTKK